jgi:hypothetical protein
LQSIDELKINQSPDETMYSNIVLFYYMQPSNIRVCCDVAAGIALVFLLVYMNSGTSSHISEAHLSGQTIQNWISQKYNILIQFTYEPERPVIDEFTELIFSVQNLSSGEHIENLTGRVVVTNGQRLFKFEKISIPDGDFSVRYLFPDDGTHQVLLRIDRNNDLRIIASFNVFVPHQPPPSLLDPFMQEDKVYLTLSIVAILSIVIFFVIQILKKSK